MSEVRNRKQKVIFEKFFLFIFSCRESHTDTILIDFLHDIISTWGDFFHSIMFFMYM